MVNDERGNVEVGVLVSKSLYEMNESRLLATRGEGGWETVFTALCVGEPATWEVVSPSDGDKVAVVVKVCVWGSPCSCVVVVGEDSSDDAVEKYADVGVDDTVLNAPGGCGVLTDCVLIALCKFGLARGD